MLKMRNMKQRERNNGTKTRGGNSKKGISDIKMQGWKLRETETAAQCCRGWKNAKHEHSGKASMESRWLL